MCILIFCVFKQKTAYEMRISDWSSDVCSSDLQSQQDARGGFMFTGATTGSDFADFLLGIPHASSIAFGNADKYLVAPSYDAYVTDDWRFGPDRKSVV